MIVHRPQIICSDRNNEIKQISFLFCIFPLKCFFNIFTPAITMIVTFNKTKSSWLIWSIVFLGQVHRIHHVCGSPFKITCLKRRSVSFRIIMKDPSEMVLSMISTSIYGSDYHISPYTGPDYHLRCPRDVNVPRNVACWWPQNCCQRPSRSDVSYWVSHWVLVSRLYWCDSGEWCYLLKRMKIMKMIKITYAGFAYHLFYLLPVCKTIGF